MTIAILRHTLDNDLGAYTEVLDGRGLAYRYINPEDWAGTSVPENPADWSGIVILGGPMNIDDFDDSPFLQPERAFITRAIAADLPIFGICLGGQMLARCLGASVHAGTTREVGWTPIALTEAGRADPVFAALGDRTPQFQWHDDTFELPAGAVLLASTAQCANQAFRYGSRIYGVQFHPEIAVGQIHDWLDTSQSVSDADKDAIRAETERIADHARHQSQALFNRFWQHTGL